MEYLQVYLSNEVLKYVGEDAKQLHKNIDYALGKEALMTIPHTLANGWSVTFKTSAIEAVYYKEGTE